MTFIKYPHLERFGATEVLQIELGDCYVFPKIDGTNASLWLADGQLQAGSRSRHLSLESDNAGFYAWAVQQPNLLAYFNENPTHRLYGEWLVPHSLKTYRETAWRKFYVFDVMVDGKFLPYQDYFFGLDMFQIDYIPPICKIKNGDYERFIDQLAKNVFLIEDDKGAGEGIVIKNYDFKNRFGRQTWAKIVTSEFKEKHAKVMGASELPARKLVEEDIANKYVTKALCEKVFAKIENEVGWSSKLIPRLLNTVYYDLVKEDCWEFIKEHKNPNINFGTLQHMTFRKVKEQLPQLF